MNQSYETDRRALPPEPSIEPIKFAFPGIAAAEVDIDLACTQIVLRMREAFPTLGHIAVEHRHERVWHLYNYSSHGRSLFRGHWSIFWNAPGAVEDEMVWGTSPEDAIRQAVELGEKANKR